MPERQNRFAAFESWNFRSYFVGQIVSSSGTWMQTFAQVWLVLQITDSSGHLGVTVALQYIPLLLFGAHAGVLADRIDNRRLLIATSFVGGLLALGLGVITHTGNASTWVIDAFALAFGCVTALERPAMQAIVFQLVGAERLASAVGINGIINTAARLVGPSIAGLLIATAGIAACFFVNAASYLVVIGALLFLRKRDLVARPLRAKGAGGLREGLRYVRSNPDVSRPLVVMALVGTLAYNFQTTIPSMVKFGFGRGAGSVAAVMSISAIGSIAGGLVIAGLRLDPRRSLAVSLIGLAIGLALFGAAPNYACFVVVCLPLGFVSSSFLTVNATVLQQATDPAMQGRVMSLHQIAWFGSTPIGALLMGALIEATSTRVPFFVGAASALVCSAVIMRPRRQAGATLVGHGAAASS